MIVPVDVAQELVVLVAVVAEVAYPIRSTREVKMHQTVMTLHRQVNHSVPTVPTTSALMQMNGPLFQ